MPSGPTVPPPFAAPDAPGVVTPTVFPATPTVGLIRGDGIGPEVVAAALQAVEGAGGQVKWEELLAGQEALHRAGHTVPEATVEAIRGHGVALKGPLATPIGKGFASVNVALRKIFNLYANYRPARSFEGVKTRYENVDIIVFRENTEGMYAGIEQSLSPDGEVGRTVSQITRSGSRRIVRFAFEYARKHGRKQVCALHKANILKATSGLFLDVARQLSQEYPEIQFREMIMDNACMQLVRDPTQFDVLVTTNLFGDLVSDLCAGLVGGLGLTPSANVGENCAIFEAVHGTAPDIAGKGLANPTATMLAAAMLLEHVGQIESGTRLRRGVELALRDIDSRTGDLGGKGSTEKFTRAVLRAMS
jgi:isocitrate dehydrogenase (NAD+)